MKKCKDFYRFSPLCNMCDINSNIPCGKALKLNDAMNMIKMPDGKCKCPTCGNEIIPIDNHLPTKCKECHQVLNIHK